MMPRIITISLNTAVDNIIEIETFERGIVTNAIYSKYYPSGKAINSARTISSLKEEVDCFGFVGKSEFEFFASLGSPQLEIKLSKIEGRTRTNITLIDSNHELVLHTRTHGYSLTKALFARLCDSLNKRIKQNDIVVLSGSIPDGIPANSYGKIITICKKRGAKVIFDSSKLYLKSTIQYLPYAIKPNIDELSELFDKKLETDSEIITACRHLNDIGIEMVLVSLGSKGVILCCKGSEIYWKASVNLPKRKYRGEEIGCGDAMVGGIAIALKNMYSLESLLRIGVACGAANLLTEGPGVCNPSDVKALIRKVKIRSYKFKKNRQS